LSVRTLLTATLVGETRSNAATHKASPTLRDLVKRLHRRVRWLRSFYWLTLLLCRPITAFSVRGTRPRLTLLLHPHETLLDVFLRCEQLMAPLTLGQNFVLPSAQMHGVETEWTQHPATHGSPRPGRNQEQMATAQSTRQQEAPNVRALRTYEVALRCYGIECPSAAMPRDHHATTVAGFPILKAWRRPLRAVPEPDSLDAAAGFLTDQWRDTVPVRPGEALPRLLERQQRPPRVSQASRLSWPQACSCSISSSRPRRLPGVGAAEAQISNGH
jgi:hypothetical protein